MLSYCCYQRWVHIRPIMLRCKIWNASKLHFVMSSPSSVHLTCGISTNHVAFSCVVCSYETCVLSKYLYVCWQFTLHLTHYDLLTSYVNIGSGNGLLSDVTKPLPEPMLTYHQRCSLAFTWEQFPQILSWNLCMEITLLRLLPCLPGACELTIPVLLC